MGLESRTELPGPGAVDNAFEKRQVHPAHQLRVLAGQSMERAVVEHDIAALGSRLVAVIDEDVDNGRPRWARPRATRAPPLLGDVA